MNPMRLFRPVQTHSIEGLMLVAGFLEYAMLHPEAFTPGAYTECGVGLLGATAVAGAGRAYAQHKFQRGAPEPQPTPLPPTLPGET